MPASEIRDGLTSMRKHVRLCSTLRHIKEEASHKLQRIVMPILEPILEPKKRLILSGLIIIPKT